MPQYYTPLLLPPALVKAQQAFGLALLQQVAQAAPQTNVFLSPFSVATALLLALEGSTGAAHAAIARTLQVGEITPDKLATAVTRQLAVLTQEVAGQPVFSVANALWAAKEFTLAPDFVARLRQHYQAEAATLDFAAPDAADVINAWVSRHTQGRITRIVEAATLARQAALVLANAVYFKGQWAVEFGKAGTHPGAFTLADGTQQTVPLMQRCSGQFGYQRGAGWQAVRLRYQGYPRSASMQLFIPDQPTGLAAFLLSLNTASWAAWQTAFTHQVEVDLTLPRFRLEWDGDLTAALRTLGLGAALSPSADFAPMGFPPDMPGFIGQVAHKTYLEVDEKGTEAAGVTVLMMVGSGPPSTPPDRVVVRADRPFFCAIVDDETGTILFSGAVYQPD
ncbi:MAG: serpin family protein [Janthinobacterium lividum]